MNYRLIFTTILLLFVTSISANTFTNFFNNITYTPSASIGYTSKQMILSGTGQVSFNIPAQAVGECPDGSTPPECTYIAASASVLNPGASSGTSLTSNHASLKFEVLMQNNRALLKAGLSFNPASGNAASFTSIQALSLSTETKNNTTGVVINSANLAATQTNQLKIQDEGFDYNFHLSPGYKINNWLSAFFTMNLTHDVFLVQTSTRIDGSVTGVSNGAPVTPTNINQTSASQYKQAVDALTYGIEARLTPFKKHPNFFIETGFNTGEPGTSFKENSVLPTIQPGEVFDKLARVYNLTPSVLSPTEYNLERYTTYYINLGATF